MALDPTGSNELRSAAAQPPPPDLVEPSGVEVSPAGLVNLHVSDQPLSTVLRLLSVEGQRNIVTTADVEGRVSADLYGVTFDEALQAVLTANQCGYVSRGNFIYVYTNEELANLSQSKRPPTTQVFRLYYVSATDASAAIEPLLSDIGSVNASPAAEKGIAPEATGAGGDALSAHDYLVVHDYPENLAEIERVLNEIDVRPQQVLVEATILRATLNDDNALGIDFTALGGVDLKMLGANSPGVTDLTTGDLPVSRFDDFNAAFETDFRGSVQQGGVTFGIVSDHVGFFIRALEQVTDTVVLANPKILCLNKQKGQVIVGRRDGYLTTTVTETQAIQTIEFLETGTQLVFRPYIGRNGDVRMELHPEDSIGGLTPANLPFETTTEVTTNIQCRDGQTILIGGLFREVTTDARGQIPLLGDIPVIGQAFRSNRDTINSEEVIILLTVHIVKDDDAYAEASRKQLEDFERVRVGTRSGLMWHDRERLAQAHYHKAVEYYANHDEKRALWHLRLSLHNQPRLLPAIKLREDILQERAWDDEGGVTRQFVRRLIAEESGIDPNVQPFGRPGVPPAVPDGVQWDEASE